MKVINELIKKLNKSPDELAAQEQVSKLYDSHTTVQKLMERSFLAGITYRNSELLKIKLTNEKKEESA